MLLNEARALFYNDRARRIFFNVQAFHFVMRCGSDCPDRHLVFLLFSRSLSHARTILQHHLDAGRIRLCFVLGLGASTKRYIISTYGSTDTPRPVQSSSVACTSGGGGIISIGPWFARIVQLSLLFTLLFVVLCSSRCLSRIYQEPLAYYSRTISIALIGVCGMQACVRLSRLLREWTHAWH